MKKANKSNKLPNKNLQNLPTFYIIYTYLYYLSLMGKTNKILIYSVITISCLYSWVFADDRKSDCEIFANRQYHQEWRNDWFTWINQVWWTTTNKYSNFLSTDQQLSIIDKESLNTAVLNLKKYCCENWDKLKLSFSMKDPICNDDKVFFNDNALDSPYLFNHLFDVIMRRYIWLTWENDIYINSNMVVDEKWAERRNRIIEQTTDLSWSNPQIILDKYKEYRTATTEYAKMPLQIHRVFSRVDDLNFLNYISWNWGENNDNEQSESKMIADALKDYTNRSLFDKYTRSLALSEYFYILIWQNSYPADKSTVIQTLNTNNTFSEAINSLINSEVQYTQAVIQTSANRYITNYIDSFLWYLSDRTEKFKKTRKDNSDRWLTITRSVSKLEPNCTK